MTAGISLIGRFVDHPYFRLGLGGALVVTGALGLTETIFETMIGIDIEVEHGVVLLGLVHGLKALDEAVQGGHHIRSVRKRD